MTTLRTRYIVRPGRASDAAALARLQASVQLQPLTGGQPHPGIAAWVEGLLDGHPTVTPDDFLVAEDQATGRPVASLAGIRQTWRPRPSRTGRPRLRNVGRAALQRGALHPRTRSSARSMEPARRAQAAARLVCPYR